MRAQPSRQAVLAAERYADGLATAAELDVNRTAVARYCEMHPGELVYVPSYWACGSTMLEAAQ
jgi:hypothetical protein